MQKCIRNLGTVLIREQEAAMVIASRKDRAHKGAAILEVSVLDRLFVEGVTVCQLGKV